MDKEIKSAWINGICIIIAAFIGIFSFNINIENNKLTDDKKILKSENDTLKVKIANLEMELSQYQYLKEENESLKNELAKLQREIQSLKENSPKNEPQNGFDSSSSDIQTSKKISMFDLDTFQGEGGWHKSTSDADYTDTYDNEYVTSYWGKHYSISKNIKHSLPVYLLDKKYSICEGQIAWSKGSKNIEESAWIEFYSGDECIYTTEAITAESRVLSFSFSVEGIEKLTIVRNSTKNMNDWDTIHIIYPYLNLIE